MLYLGTNIKEYRLKKGYTQEQLAYELGVSSQTISRWENGTTYPDIEFLPAIARIFGTTVDGLIGCDATPSDEEMEQMPEISKRVIEGVKAWATIGADRAMNIVNTRPK